MGDQSGSLQRLGGGRNGPARGIEWGCWRRSCSFGIPGVRSRQSGLPAFAPPDGVLLAAEKALQAARSTRWRRNAGLVQAVDGPPCSGASRCAAHSRRNASCSARPERNERITSARRKPQGSRSCTDFYAHMPSGDFIFIPSRDFWPARSVDARIPRVTTSAAEGHQATIKASGWIAKNRPVEQVTWAPGRPELIADVLATEGGFIPQPGRSVFNLYRPPLLELGDPKEAGQWLVHLKRVYPSDSSHILNWRAHRVQRAGEKINHALVLGGAPGVGKDAFAPSCRTGGRRLERG